MLRILARALFGGTATVPFDDERLVALSGPRRRPVVHVDRWSGDRAPIDACPTGALSVGADRATRHETLTLSYASCVFCGRCAEAGRDRLVEMEPDTGLSSEDKAALIKVYDLKTREELRGETTDDWTARRGEALRRFLQRRIGRSLHVREVDAGSCNGCEAEIAALSNPVYDLERFGIHFVASPRHADALLVTGPVTRQMEIALRKTYEATPDPKVVIAAGACGCSGGIFRGSYGVVDGVDQVVPVDVYIPGCPPRPETLLQGLLLAALRFAEKSRPPIVRPLSSSAPVVAKRQIGPGGSADVPSEPEVVAAIADPAGDPTSARPTPARRRGSARKKARRDSSGR